MPSNAVQQLLEQGQRSGLFSAAAARDLIAQAAADSAQTADEAAAQMVEKKLLTPYQAEQLLAGRGDECMVAGRYRILDKLGEGGMGAVYKAHDIQLDRDVAVKILPGHRLQDADAIARFRREARALAKLSHPNIIQAYDSGEDKGRHFLVMEYAEGVSLSAILREQGAVPPTVAAGLIYQAALGLQHAHQRGLVHRDLKPANLLLSPASVLPGHLATAAKDQARPSPDLTTSYVAPAALSKGIVKILDLGLARFLQDQLGDSQLTGEGVGVGTPDYMAPEQFRDALHADARTDIYSLGCTLYHLISGTVPFPGSSLSEKAEAHAKKEPIPLEERCPEVPAGLAFVVSKMMAKHPADRLQTAAEAAESLAPYVAGASHSMIVLRESMRFQTPPLTRRPPRPRRRLLAWSAAAVAAACLVGLLILAWPNLFPHSSGGSQPDAKDPTAAPGNANPEPAKPAIITIGNGLTVAKDGTGQYTTIGEALANVKPGMTVEVVDDATYEETLALNDAQKYTGLVLEATKGATILLSGQSRHAVSIRGVPNLRVKGFRLRDSGAVRGSEFVQVSSRCPGLTLEGLDIQAAGQVNGFRLSNVVAEVGEPPLVLTQCSVRTGYHGLVVEGSDRNDEGSPLSGGIQIRQNRISAAGWGVQIQGAVSRIHVVGNVVWNCGLAGIQLQDFAAGSNQVLVANNTVSQCTAGFRVWDNEPFETHVRGQVDICNNILLDAQDIDMGCYQAPKGGQTRPGDGQALLKVWRFDCNWRDLSGQEAATIIPLAPNDKKLLAGNALFARESSDKGYLRPAKESPLVTAGAGGDLPSYVGAVPPEGIAPWDWDKTWEARVRTSEQQGKKPAKD
jgi:serine/threonine protein kinase